MSKSPQGPQTDLTTEAISPCLAARFDNRRLLIVIAVSVLGLSEVVVGAFLTLVLLYFLLAGGDRLLEKSLGLTPEWGSKRRIVVLARDIQQGISSYLFATTCINLVLGVVIGLGMWLIGLPNPLLWGAMAAGLNYIPYFGCTVGTCIVFQLAFPRPIPLRIGHAERHCVASVWHFDAAQARRSLCLPAAVAKPQAPTQWHGIRYVMFQHSTATENPASTEIQMARS